MNEPNTPSPDGTDNVPTSASDTPETFDYYDPDEDQDTEEVEADTGTDDEEQAEEEPEAEEDADEQAEGEESPPEKALVTLADGTKVTHDELVAGYSRQADYTRKAQAVAEERKTVAASADRIERITEAFVDHLVRMMPKEPDTALALSDPNKYTAQRAQYEAAVAQVQQLIAIGEEPKKVNEDERKAAFTRLKSEEDAKLAQHMPEMATEAGRAKFFEGMTGVADELGFSVKELQGAIDHRFFRLAALAKDGLAARKAKAAATAKAEKAPPVTPRKPGQGAAKANGNAEAMRKLGRTGSLRDALAVDFD